ncbi:MAG: hypothetical protein HQ568_03110 [Calditrichaeota bacterium]|nr:hypothetical protein [Calditrichota bacterium]
MRLNKADIVYGSSWWGRRPYLPERVITDIFYPPIRDERIGRQECLPHLQYITKKLPYIS